MRQMPIRSTPSRKRSTDRFTSKPGIASNLSSVPPVCPRPRPLIMGTRTPAAAAMGPRMSDVLSPTPPVLCLSTLTPGISEKSSTSPEWSIASVSAWVSAVSMPLMRMAMSSALIW